MIVLIEDPMSKTGLKDWNDPQNNENQEKVKQKYYSDRSLLLDKITEHMTAAIGIVAANPTAFPDEKFKGFRQQMDKAYDEITKPVFNEGTEDFSLESYKAKIIEL